MRVGIDATPLLGQRTGVGRYVAGLIEGLGAIEDGPHLVLTAFTARRSQPLADWGASVSGRRFPARALQWAWRRHEFPPVEWLSGRVDVFHATNYVLPPTRSAAGVVTVHDLSFLHHADTVDSASLAYQQLVPRSLARARVTLADSHAVAEEIQETYGLSPDRTAVARLGVDRIWFETRAPSSRWLDEHGLPPEYLLFVGTLEPRKNLPVLLAAYRALLHEAEVPPLVLVGASGWGPALDTAGLGPREVVIPGYLPDDDLRQVVAGALGLVLPSRYEGFGLPVLEALACGTAVVASDIPALREVGGAHVDYASADDPDDLAAALARAIDRTDSDEVRTDRRAYASQWTWQRCAEETLAAYRRALGF